MWLLYTKGTKHLHQKAAFFLNCGLSLLPHFILFSCYYYNRCLCICVSHNLREGFSLRLLLRPVALILLHWHTYSLIRLWEYYPYWCVFDKILRASEILTINLSSFSYWDISTFTRCVYRLFWEIDGEVTIITSLLQQKRSSGKVYCRS